MQKNNKIDQKTQSRQDQFKDYVDNHKLIEKFADLFVTLYDRKMPNKADSERIVKDYFCSNQLLTLKDNMERYKKENEQLKKEVNDLKSKIKLIKENQPKRKTVTTGYYAN